MKSLNIVKRVKSALKLQPMTVKTLALCLSISLSAVYKALQCLCASGLVRASGFASRKNYSPILWSLS